MRGIPLPLLILGGVCGLFFLPAILLGSGGDDLIFHTLRAEYFARQLWDGVLYPRWLPELHAGCGSPVFFFYPPLAFYLAALFHFLHAMDPAGWYPPVAASFAACLMGAVGCYAWLRRHVSSSAACAGAIFYATSPYHLLNFYGSFAFPEYVAISFLPVMLYCLDRAIAGQSRAWLGYALAQAGLILTNVPATIALSPLPVFYAVFLIGRTRRYQDIAKLLGSIGLSFGLAAIYLVPMLEQKGFVQVGDKASDFWRLFHFDYRDAFLTEEHQKLKAVVASYCCLSARQSGMRFVTALRAGHYTISGWSSPWEPSG